MTSTNSENFVLVRLFSGNEKLGLHSTGEYGIKIWFKTDKETKAKKPDYFVLLPALSVTIEPANLRDAIQDYIRSMQKSIVTNAILEQHEKGNTASFQMPIISLSSDAIAEYARASERGERLNADQIKAWVSDNLETSLFTSLASRLFGATSADAIDKLNDDQTTTLSQKVNGFIAAYSSLAAPNPKVNLATLTSMKNGLALASDETKQERVYEFLTGKVTRLIEQATKPVEDLGL